MLEVPEGEVMANVIDNLFKEIIENFSKYYMKYEYPDPCSLKIFKWVLRKKCTLYSKYQKLEIKGNYKISQTKH
jgi:hypothetical protein